MKKLEDTALVRAMYRLREKPLALLAILFLFCLFLATYLISKHQDQKVITYQSKQDFSTGRVLSRNNDIYRKKDRVYTDKIDKLEQQISQINQQLKDYLAKMANKQEETPPTAEAPRGDLVSKIRSFWSFTRS